MFPYIDRITEAGSVDSQTLLFTIIFVAVGGLWFVYRSRNSSQRDDPQPAQSSGNLDVKHQKVVNKRVSAQESAPSGDIGPKPAFSSSAVTAPLVALPSLSPASTVVRAIAFKTPLVAAITAAIPTATVITRL
jgi:hypothetical protein